MSGIGNASVLALCTMATAMVAVATAGATLIVPPVRSGGTDAVGVACLASAILLIGLGIAMAGFSALRKPRAGRGAVSAATVRFRALSILALALGQSGIALAAAPAIPPDAANAIPVALYGLACLAILARRFGRALADTDPKLPRGTGKE